jgi:hypothetical protein
MGEGHDRIQEMTRRAVSILVAATALPTLIVAGGLTWATLAFHAATREVTDPAQYQLIVSQLRQNLSPGAAKGLTHFPALIPASAVNPRFYYLPHFLQGGTRFQVRYGLPHKQIEALATHYKTISQQTTQGSVGAFAAVHGQKGLPTANFRNDINTQFGPLPTDFTVYVIDAIAGYSPTDIDRGYSYGTAVSLQRNEVIYWLEDW